MSSASESHPAPIEPDGLNGDRRAAALSLRGALVRARPLMPLARRGLLAALGLVAAAAAATQLALPLVFEALLSALRGGEPGRAWPLAGAFAGCMLGAGVADHFLRLRSARFAIAWSRDVRAAAFGAAAARRSTGGASAGGDLVARLIADVARFKAGVKVLLVYVLANALLLLGAGTVLTWRSPLLGSLFLAATLGVGAVAVLGARANLRAYGKVRELEGRVADFLADGSSPAADGEEAERLNRGSADLEVFETRLTSRTTVAAHGIVGAAVAAALLLGARAVEAGTLAPAVLALFVVYVLFLAKPLVRLARHGARTGKVLASACRLAELVAGTGGPSPSAPGPAGRIEFSGGGVALPAGARIAVVGPAASGKSSFLEGLARRPSPWDARLTTAEGVPGEWDTATLAPEPVWERTPIAKILGVAKGDRHAGAILQAVGFSGGEEGLSRGLATRVSSNEVSWREARALFLGRLLAGDAQVLLLDDPLAGLDAAAGEALLRAIGEHAAGRLVVLSSSVPLDAADFDLVLELDGGHVVRAAGGAAGGAA